MTTSRKAKGKGSHATTVEIFAIHARLTEVLTQVGDRLWTYPDNLSDEAVAAGLGVATGSVKRIRAEMFGNLRPATGGNAKLIDELSAHIVTLTEKLAAQQGAFDELKLKHNNLCSHLSLNRITDVRHLEIKDAPPRPPAR